MSTPSEPVDLKELKKKQDDQQTRIDNLTKSLDGKLTSAEFGTKWDEKKEQADKQAKKENNKFLDDYEGYQATALTGQKSEANIAKEEVNGLNAAVNTLALSLVALEFSWSLFKIEFKPLFTPRWVDKVNQAIGRLQDRRGWNNPEGDAQRELDQIKLATRHLQNRAHDAHVRIAKTNLRIDKLQGKINADRRALRDTLRTNDRSARSMSLGNLSGTEADIRRLEIRVQALVRAL